MNEKCVTAPSKELLHREKPLQLQRAFAGSGIPGGLQTGEGMFQGVAAPQRRVPASPETGAVNAIQCSGNDREITLA